MRPIDPRFGRGVRSATPYKVSQSGDGTGPRPFCVTSKPQHANCSFSGTVHHIDFRFAGVIQALCSITRPNLVALAGQARLALRHKHQKANRSRSETVHSIGYIFGSGVKGTMPLHFKRSSRGASQRMRDFIKHQPSYGKLNAIRFLRQGVSISSTAKAVP